MIGYIATFHTHLSAMMTCRALTKAGVAAHMMPVPRALSSSCGTCVSYAGERPCLELLDADVERVYGVEGEKGYLLVKEFA